MADIVFSSNPAEWAALDGIYVNEVTPPGNIQGINTGIVGILGEFERGPTTIQSIGSPQELVAAFGGRGANNYAGYLGLVNKSFGPMRVRRVVAAAAAAATRSFNTGATPTLKTDANSKGGWGNNLTVQIAAGTDSGSKVIVTYTSSNPAFVDVETFDNATTDSLVALNGTAQGSKYVIFTKLAAGTPDVAAAAALTGGADGVVAASDYTAAIADFETVDQQDVTILFVSNAADAMKATINPALVAHAAAVPYQLVILSGQSTDTVAAAIAAKKALTARDNWVYVFNHAKTILADGSTITVGPESFLASLCSQTLPESSVADPDTIASCLWGVNGLSQPSLTRQNYKDLKAAGICSFDAYDSDLGGFKFKSSVTSYYPQAKSKGVPDQGMIETRRMKTYCELSVAKRLKWAENKSLPLGPDGKLSAEHFSVLGEMNTFYQDLQDNQRIAGFSLDKDSGNTAAGLAAGVFNVIQYVKTNPKSDSIVVTSQVGVTVQP